MRLFQFNRCVVISEESAYRLTDEVLIFRMSNTRIIFSFIGQKDNPYANCFYILFLMLRFYSIYHVFLMFS